MAGVTSARERVADRWIDGQAKQTRNVLERKSDIVDIVSKDIQVKDGNRLLWKWLATETNVNVNEDNK